MTEEEDKLAEEATVAEAEAKAKADEEAKAAEALLQEQEIDYKTLKTLAEAEKVRADAAEALIIKNKSIAKRKEGDGETPVLSEKRVSELIQQALTSQDVSPEATALAEAQKNLRVIQAKNAEIARALKNKSTPVKDVAESHRDGEQAPAPKLPEGSPLKSYKHEGGGIYSKKLANGKTLYINSKPGMGEQKKWVK